MMAMSAMMLKIMLRMMSTMRMVRMVWTVMLITNKEKKRYLAAVWNGVSPYWEEKIIW